MDFDEEGRSYSTDNADDFPSMLDEQGGDVENKTEKFIESLHLDNVDADLDTLGDDKQSSCSTSTAATNGTSSSVRSLWQSRLVLFQLAEVLSIGGWYPPDPIIFSFRISVSCTCGALFVLAFPVDDPWPSATWIYITAAIVSWMPSIDTASVLKKTIERTIGTMIGAFFGLAVGFISLKINDLTWQAVFLASAIAVHGFVYPYTCDRLGFRTSYAAWLGCFTFGLVALAFFDKQHSDKPWFTGMHRIMNIVIGCSIVAAVSLLVWPLSTKVLLHKKVDRLLQRTGQSAEMVLNVAIDAFADQRKRPALAEIIGKDDFSCDVHTAYIKNVESWKDCKSLFPMLKYDPFFWPVPREQREYFRNHMAVRLARCFRIQMNIVMLDAITRSDTCFKGPKESLIILKDVGQRAKVILDLSVDHNERDGAVRVLLEHDLVRLRQELAQMANGRVLDSQVNIDILTKALSSFVGLPLSHVDGNGEQSLLFLQLVEHLILRVARCHYYIAEYKSTSKRCCCGRHGTKTTFHKPNGRW